VDYGPDPINDYGPHHHLETDQMNSPTDQNSYETKAITGV